MDVVNFTRILQIEKLIKLKSIFLLGPRWTGKSTLLKIQFPEALYIDLLDRSTFRELTSKTKYFKQQIHAFVSRYNKKIIVVDEIQRFPELLSEVHQLIEQDKNIRFILTGSSARKLRRSGINLLAGRASWQNFFPITYAEVLINPNHLSLNQLIQYGGLPAVLTSSDPKRELQDYVGLYLKEEVQAEGLSRKIENFSRFLDTVASTNGEQVQFESIANDAQIPARTVRDYYQILEDTLVGYLLPCYQKTKTRKAMSSAKFYFFDIGVNHSLLGRDMISSKSPEYGRAIEHLVCLEIKAALSYLRKEAQLYYWRSLSQFEVDFLIVPKNSSPIGIEVKAKENVSNKDTRGLSALSEDIPNLKKIVVSLESKERLLENKVEIIPLELFLKDLWSGKII